ncbi:MAG TPA: ShlB/FhaC/HecB family hemolysin secretion/activation protein [Negativicutes bacterium]|nr:ShlB/FhaC/HecB family hemolysin secretion/activation protein [Negativicutes bacterium]
MKKTPWHYGRMYTALIALLFFLATLPVAAAPPSSGAVLEGAKPPASQLPGEKKGPSITVDDKPPAVNADDQQKIPVKGFRISGEPPMPANGLLGLIEGDAGKEITLGELSALAGKLTQHMRKNGYLVAFAYIPAQDIKDGIVEVAVIPGKYGQVKIEGRGRFDHDLLKAMLHTAKTGTVITQGALERALLILSDLGGVRVKATLSPGEAAGSADLILEISDTARWRGTAFADNWGNRYTSSNRLGVQMTAGNIDGRGADLSLGGLISEKSRMTNYNLGYSAFLGNDGARFSVKHSRVDYTLGESYADLGATGQATVTSGDLSYPLVRNRAFSLYGTLGYDGKRLRDDQRSVDSYVPKKSHMVSVGLAGNFTDSWLGGGHNDFTIIYYKGRLTIEDTGTADTDANTARAAGNFSKTVVSYGRQQTVAENLAFHLNFTGQLADKNLDSSEKIFLGGADGVRAFPQGEAAGDTGYKLTGELRWRLPGLSAGKDNVYLAGFYDYGSVIVNHTPWTGAGDSNRRSLMGAGLGLLWTRSPDFSLRLDYAWKLGKEQATADTDKNGRLWLQGIKYF